MRLVNRNAIKSAHQTSLVHKTNLKRRNKKEGTG